MNVLDSIDKKYQQILQKCEPFLLTYPENLKCYDLAPFGVKIKEENLYSCIDSKKATFFDLLYRLDGLSFGQVGMPMDKWVFFDCGEMPGGVFGFQIDASYLPDEAKAEYQVPEGYKGPVPICMYIAIPMASNGTWFGHNLCTANRVLGEKGFPGLALLCKAFGLKVLKIKKMLGATQWDSSSLNIHLQLADMGVYSSYTPAHSFVKTMTYVSNYTDEGLIASLSGSMRVAEKYDLLFDGEDEQALINMQKEIEEKKYSYTIVGRPIMKGEKRFLPLKKEVL
jgi:hypothetical protein